MLQRALVFALTLTAAGDQAPWQRTDSRRFEIHYPPALAGELERVTRSAERAYDRISGRLNFIFPKKVPLVMFSSSGPMTR